MAVRNLYRQARPFRVLGWGLFAMLLVALPPHQLSNSQLVAGLLLAVLGAGVLDVVRLLSAPRGTPPSDTAVRQLQRAETLLVPGALLSMQLPLPLTLSVLGTLVTANVALGGGRVVPGVLLAFASSGLVVVMLAAFAGAPDVLVLWQRLPGVTGISNWLPGTLLLLTFAVALCDVAFRLTQKLDDHRSLWRDRLATLQPFVPHGLARRLPIGQSRCWVTVVIIDLVEFTVRSSPLPPELVSLVLDDLLDAVVVQAGRCGGTLDKFMGDGALLFFLPEQDRSVAAHNAWRFANQLLAQLPELNNRWASFGLEQQLQLRVGLASGYCSLGECGTSDVRAYTIIGSCVALAERLQATSQADSMVLCPLTMRLLLEAGLAREGGVRVASAPLPDLVRIEFAEVNTVEFSASYEDFKGFARMRVFRPSAKVRTPIA